jgi:hypothetical protein
MILITSDQVTPYYILLNVDTFADLPEDWVCPLCGVPKSDFELAE